MLVLELRELQPGQKPCAMDFEDVEATILDLGLAEMFKAVTGMNKAMSNPTRMKRMTVNEETVLNKAMIVKTIENGKRMTTRKNQSPNHHETDHAPRDDMAVVTVPHRGLLHLTKSLEEVIHTKDHTSTGGPKRKDLAIGPREARDMRTRATTKTVDAKLVKTLPTANDHDDTSPVVIIQTEIVIAIGKDHDQSPRRDDLSEMKGQDPANEKRIVTDTRNVKIAREERTGIVRKINTDDIETEKNGIGIKIGRKTDLIDTQSHIKIKMMICRLNPQSLLLPNQRQHK
jgi:hypothetical protein